MASEEPAPGLSSNAADIACPCCFQQTLEERANFEICPECGWEDDGQDDADAHIVRGGPNGGLSLTQARLHFGDHQTLLRAAIACILDTRALGAQSHWDKPFKKRRQGMPKYALDQPQLLRLEALLALDGDPELTSSRMAWSCRP
ncbi:CPCC family cysteine-rich protein [Streptomyces sp. NPDC055749]